VSFELLSAPFESLDEQLTELFASAPLLVSLGVAFLLGLRHASDPDHLVAVTSLMARDGGNVRSALTIGAWWGLGHALVLIAIGMPLILLKSSLPSWLERGAEAGVGVIIVLLAGRLIRKWARGDYRAAHHRHSGRTAGPSVATGSHRHLHAADERAHTHPEAENARTPRGAFVIGVIHGLARTGAVVVLLIAALPSRLEAVAAMAVFAPMSVVSMSFTTAALAWILTRSVVEPFSSALDDAPASGGPADRPPAGLSHQIELAG
jgi:ABC-type nickel/cobalt efflux system permease component RcnA